MTDEDARLRRLLARAAEAPEDDAFVARVEQRIKRARRARRILAVSAVLVGVVCLVLLTPLLIDAGMRITAGIDLASRGAVSVMLSPIGALLALVAGVALFAARRR